MSEICQKSVPVRPWAEQDLARLPGMRPVAMADWLVADEAYAAQMAERDRLIREKRDAVLAPAPEDIGSELLEILLANLPSGYACDGTTVQRPDGINVALASDTPLAVAARLVQEDLCILEEKDAAYHLTAAALLFPASWTLSEKLNRPMVGIHEPVAEFDDGIATRVHRLFTALRPAQPLMRANWLLYQVSDLFHPRRENERREKTAPRYLRVERQCLLRLPKTRAICFSIHTYVLRLEDVSADDLRLLGAAS